MSEMCLHSNKIIALRPTSKYAMFNWRDKFTSFYKKEEKQKKAATLRNYNSCLRPFCEWLDKEKIITPTSSTLLNYYDAQGMSMISTVRKYGKMIVKFVN